MIGFGILGLPTAIICGPFYVQKWRNPVPTPKDQVKISQVKKKITKFFTDCLTHCFTNSYCFAGTVVEQTAISGIDPGLTKAENA